MWRKIMLGCRTQGDCERESEGSEVGMGYADIEDSVDELA
jgi:hypothetical protein